ncbi:MAG: hypothetical protein A2V72_01925 [Candidatus Nealsonbacteria bacterium RBG_13_37_56]|uniref:Uncharacterized protein n=1 Tax=Candidatus Nealsonbacteria bacterium RBG_13_37_56 TaxID=1801661 RepID=A0A1G2DVX0_9BACT|nr:MAG: hypothetical protein A2V72_01925 [Candidatus Nealsonbacteria bacterium RBG_13_37_56]
MNNFTRNTLITFITKCLYLLTGVGITVFIARTLGVEGKGIYSLAVLLPTLLVVFANLGIGSASVYFTAKNKYPIKEIISSNIILSGIVSLFVLMLGLIIVFFFSDLFFPGVSQKYLLLSLVLFPFQIFINYLVNVLLGLHRVKKYNLINLASIFIFFLLLLLLSQYGLITVIISQILGLFFSCLLLFFWLRKEAGGLVFKINKSYLKDAFSYGFKTYLGNIFSFSFLRIDVFLINIFIFPLAVGLYSASVSIAESIWLISQSASTVLFPKITSEKDNQKIKNFTPLVCRNILFITFLMAVLLFFSAKWVVVTLFGTDFLGSVLPLQILLIGSIAISVSRILAFDFYGRGMPILSSYTNFFAIIVNVLLNIFWIPKYGIAGAAWATSVSYSFAFLVNLVSYLRISGNKIGEILLVKKSDFRFYRNFINLFKRNV